MRTVLRSPDPFLYNGGKTGILLIHGFTGTPSELRPMGEYFHQNGYTVLAPLLPGHGTTPEEMEDTGWEDWMEAVIQAYHELKERGVDTVHVVGLSMGGILALYLSILHSVTSVSTLCAPIRLQDQRAHFVRLLRIFKTYHKRGSKKSPEIERHLLPYDRVPLKCIDELLRLIRQVRRNLSQVMVPTLIIQSRNDETVHPQSAEIIEQSISSAKKRVSWYEQSSHIITLDRERRRLFREVEDFITETALEMV